MVVLFCLLVFTTSTPLGSLEKDLSKDQLVAELRQKFPARRGVSVSETRFSDGKIVSRRSVECSDDGTDWRITFFFRKIGGSGGGIVNEIIGNSDQVLQTSTSGKFADTEGLKEFRRNKKLTNTATLWPGNFLSNGGTMGPMSLLFGFIPDKKSLIDFHLPSFKKACDLRRVGEHIEIVHQDSDVAFVFSLQGKIKTIRIPRYFSDGVVMTRDGTTIVKPTEDSTAADVPITRFEIGQEGRPGLDAPSYSITKLPDNFNLKRFVSCEVNRGSIVGMLGKSTLEQKFAYYLDGRAGYLVDPIAEQEILKVLKKANPEAKLLQPKEQDRSFLGRLSYLRSATSADCGLYSLAIASAGLGVVIPLEELLANESYVTGNGSSISQLRLAAKENNLHTLAIRFGNVDHLLAANAPAIVHCGNINDRQGTGHWATVLQVNPKNRKVLWADLPHEPVWISESELMTTWDGTAIIVSPEPFGWFTSWKIRWLQLWKIVLVGLFLAAVMYWRKFISARQNRQVLPSIWNLRALFFLFGLIFAGGIMWLFFSRLSYLNQPEAVALVNGKIPALNLPTLNETWDWHDWKVDDQTLVLDARIPRDFVTFQLAELVFCRN